jgi:hypothetical protein
MRRWHEDVVLTEEEMRRTIEYGYWASGEWVQRARVRAGTAGVDAALEEGLVAYAGEQAARELTTCARLTEKWAPIRKRGLAYLARGTPTNVDIRVPIGFTDGRDSEDEEGEPDYEDEGDDDVLD